jgi:hypothetical protein
MAASPRPKRPKSRPENLVKRLNALTTGLTVSRVLRADNRELVIELSDGTRLLVKGEQQLDISVT